MAVKKGVPKRDNKGRFVKRIIPANKIVIPEQRFDVNNGIALCRSCHAKLHRKEVLCQIETVKGQGLGAQGLVSA